MLTTIVIILFVRFNTRRHANLSIPQTDRPRGRLTDHVARNPIASLRASQAKRVATLCASAQFTSRDCMSPTPNETRRRALVCRPVTAVSDTRVRRRPPLLHVCVPTRHTGTSSTFTLFRQCRWAIKRRTDRRDVLVCRPSHDAVHTRLYTVCCAACRLR